MVQARSPPPLPEDSKKESLEGDGEDGTRSRLKPGEERKLQTRVATSSRKMYSFASSVSNLSPLCMYVV